MHDAKEKSNREEFNNMRSSIKTNIANHRTYIEKRNNSTFVELKDQTKNHN